MTEFRLEGAPNFRDLGGYTNRQGKRIRPGKIFRSDHLGQLTPSDIRLLQDGFGTHWRVLDFRGVQERATAPCQLPSAEVHALSIEPTIVQKITDLIAQASTVSHEETVRLMQDTYRGFVRYNTHRYAEFFEHLLSDSDAPLVFHCTAGKDRTGFAAALLLHALDIPSEVIWQDYLKTNERLKNRPLSSQLPEPIAHVLHAVQTAFLQASLETVEQDHGGMTAYLENHLGLSSSARKKLQRLCLD
jgi:protein-tyrosine phosphatase